MKTRSAMLRRRPHQSNATGKGRRQTIATIIEPPEKRGCDDMNSRHANVLFLN
jgi:hypothetical protein